MSNEYLEFEESQWNIVKLHASLMIFSGIAGHLSNESLTMMDSPLFNIDYVYGILIFVGTTTLFIKNKATLLLSLIILFFTLFFPSFYITNEYLMPIASFILYIDLILIATVFFDIKVGLFFMGFIITAVFSWQYLVINNFLTPVISKPNPYVVTGFNAFLILYFIYVALNYRISINILYSSFSQIQNRLMSAIDARKTKIEGIKTIAKKLHTVHFKNATQINQNLAKYHESYSSSESLTSNQLKELLTDFLSVSDKEIFNINNVLSEKEIEYVSENEEHELDENDDVEDLQEEVRDSNTLIYGIVIFINFWLLITHMFDLGYFSILIFLNICIISYLIYKKNTNRNIYISTLFLQLFLLILGTFVFIDQYGSTPVQESYSMLFSLLIVYELGMDKIKYVTIPVVLTPLLKLVLYRYGYLNDLIVITSTGYELFIDLIPVMILSYILTVDFKTQSNNYFDKQTDLIFSLRKVKYTVTNRESELDSLIQDLRDLSDYNSHTLRAPIARSLGIITLYQEIGDGLEGFKNSTGYDLPKLVNDSVLEFEASFSEFDKKIQRLSRSFSA